GGGKSILDPVETQTPCVDVRGDSHHIETAGTAVDESVGGKKETGSLDDPALLVPVHSGDGTAVAQVATITHFHEDDGLRIAHDQVDLTAAAGEVAAHQHQSVVSQEAGGGLLHHRAESAFF